MIILGHRGARSIRPENTMAAFQEAFRCGAQGIELDVHLSQDGELIVMHDETVDRCTNGTGLIKDMTLAQLKELDAGGWFAPDYAGETIPTLEEVFSAFQGKDFTINVEIKTDFFFYPGIEEKVVALVGECGMGERVIVSSFNHNTIHRVKELAPGLACGHLFGQPILNPVEYTKSAGVEAIHPPMHLVDEDLFRVCGQTGVQVNVWFAQEPYFLDNLAHYKTQPFHSIITDYPQKYI